MTDAPDRVWITEFTHGDRSWTDNEKIGKYRKEMEYIRADIAEAEIERLRAVLQSMDDTIVARSELFISDQECLFNLRDRIRRALIDKEVGDG